MRMQTKLTTAVHEAGHAVARLVAGHRDGHIDQITLCDGEGDRYGYVEMQLRWQPFMAVVKAPEEILAMQRVLAFKDCRELIAGPVAELRWERITKANIDSFMINSRDFIFDGFNDFDGVDDDMDDRVERFAISSDAIKVQERLLWAYPDDPKAAFDLAFQQAAAIVQSNWKAIQALGRLVHERGTVRYEELYAWWDSCRERREAVQRVDVAGPNRLAA